MITKSNRFHGYGSLRFVYKNGKTVRGPIIAVRFLYNARRQHYRAAVVVSKKVDKSAVGRNRIRRRIYEVIRNLAIQDPYDIVVTVFHDQVAQITHEELQIMLTAQFKQAGIIATPEQNKHL